MRSYIPPGAKLVPNKAKRVFKGIIHDVYQWQQEMYDGTYATYEVIKRPDTVKIIAIKEDKLVIVEQTQPDDPDPFYDIPGGRHDNETEDELQAAKRELVEETGMEFGSWKLISCVQPHPKIDQFVYHFLATDFESIGPQHLDNGEKITVMEMSYEEALIIAEQKNARYIPKELIQKAGSIEGLKNLKALA